MKKTFRSSIRINGKQKRSPRFERKSDADLWRQAKLRDKMFLKEGVHLPVDNKMTVKQYFYGKWLVDRQKRYLKPTWGPDEQRFRDYVEDYLGGFPVAKINQLQIRTVLKNVTEIHGHSIQTRNRVRSLLSTFFNDAMNEAPPLRSDNPATNISFKDPRTGKKEPRHLKKQKEILDFMKSAKEISQTHFAYACIALMAGLRKQELVPLRWNDFLEEQSELVIDEKFIQAENRIISGTKGGTEEHRTVPIPDELCKVLRLHRKKSDFQGENDFILCRADGDYISSRLLATIHDDIRRLAGLDINPHGLRHTYGREFVKNDGSMKALQTILGHSSSNTTELYSRLAGRTVNKFRNTVSYSVESSDDE